MQQDISLLSRQKRKKLSTVRQKKVVELLNNLFSSGFHLAEIIDFLKRSALLEEVYVDRMKEELSTGKPFSDIMASLGFSDNVVTQLSLAELHGNLSLSLSKIEEYLENISKIKKKLVEVATYPFILFVFLIFIMLGLRNYLLPQLDRQNIATQIISNLPQLFLGSLGVVLVLFVIGFYWFQKSSKIAAFRLLARLPFFGTFIQTYLTAYYAREWGNMIGQGLELSQIFQMMQGQRSAMFQEIGKDLEVALQNGQEFSQVVKYYPFFKKELGLIIEYGEVKSKLGRELEVYAQKTWETFFKRVHQAMNVIQPLVFVFVALMIVLLYAAMLLPIYQNMEVQL